MFLAKYYELFKLLGLCATIFLFYYWIIQKYYLNLQYNGIYRANIVHD